MTPTRKDANAQAAVRIFIQGVPAAQPRARSTRNGIHYTDPKSPVHGWRERIALAVMGIEPIAHPVRIDWMAVMPRPRSHWKKDGTLTKGAPRLHTSKPDRDNLDKSLLDQLTASGVLIDDKAVTRGELHKRWQRTPDEPVGMFVRVTDAEDADAAWVSEIVVRKEGA